LAIHFFNGSDDVMTRIDGARAEGAINQMPMNFAGSALSFFNLFRHHFPCGKDAASFEDEDIGARKINDALCP
jgi:hypothetical protein